MSDADFPRSLLIVEDEEKTGDYLRQELTEAGFVVDLARNGLDVLASHHKRTAVPQG